MLIFTKSCFKGDILYEGLNAFMLQKHKSFLILSNAAALYSPSVWNAVFQLLLLYAPSPSWRPGLLWLVSSQTPDSTTEQPRKAASYADVGHGDTVWCHKVSELPGGLLARHFRSGVFCWREELLLVQTLTFLTFKTFHMHKSLRDTIGERKTNKHNRCLSIKTWMQHDLYTKHMRAGGEWPEVGFPAHSLTGNPACWPQPYVRRKRGIRWKPTYSEAGAVFGMNG